MSESDVTEDRESVPPTSVLNGESDSTRMQENQVKMDTKDQRIIESKDSVLGETSKDFLETRVPLPSSHAVNNLAVNEEEDVWDDRLLLKSYQRAVKMVDAALKKKKLESKETECDKLSSLNHKVAKSLDKVEDSSLVSSSCLASSSSSSHSKVRKSNDHSSTSRSKGDSCRFSHKSFVTTYRFNPYVGKSCRCPFSEDGRDYEAVILEVYPSDDSVLVRYVGYENEEVRATSLLKDSAGDQARLKQTHMAVSESEQTGMSDGQDCQASPSHESVSVTKTPVKITCTPGNQTDKSPGMRQDSPWIPCPPPPSLNLPSLSSSTSGTGSEEDEALASMLMSWYMNGYHTGYYQAMKKYRK